MARTFIDTPIEYLKGVGPKRADMLKKELNVFNFGDLIEYFPFRYIDRSKFYKISEINNDSTWFQVRGVISNIQVIGAGRAKRMTAILKDETGWIELVWFQGIRWVQDKIKGGVEYIVFGKPNFFNGKYNIPHPEIDIASERSLSVSETLQPFYSSSEKLKSKGFSTKGISKVLKTLTESAKGQIQETLSDEIISHFGFMSREKALTNIHFPENLEMLKKAQSRLKFEELFFIQLRLIRQKYLRQKNIRGHNFVSVGDYFNEFFHKNLPFPLTSAQKKVIKEIRVDVGSGKQMNRLLQGDVGSGKTLVALMTMLIALDNGYQACLMAPTEILAQQHFESISRFLEGLNVNVALLTGSTKVSVRKTIHEQLMSGELHILIGTHALLEKTVKFNNLGIVIIDEQHRFGVAQRAKLWKKNVVPPHMLVMTATPIPRTLAMTLYGDLDVSVIDELPPGRKPVKTFHYYDSARLKLFGFIRKQIELNQQVYIVYPLIQESETLDLKDLTDGYESVTRAFPLPDYAVSIVHGKMKSADKEYEMQRFVKGETQIMVATTVIEVGVDIPRASVMVIENAERFGLSQLHQLRGRVGRGADQSYCILMTGDKQTAEGKKRIETMVRTTDGFEIAEVDLRLRGPGDMQGTQQSGDVILKIADIIRDEKLLKYARDLAFKVLNNDPGLSEPANRPMAKRLNYLYKDYPNWGLIG